jgi:hypothetical protein
MSAAQGANPVLLIDIFAAMAAWFLFYHQKSAFFYYMIHNIMGLRVSEWVKYSLKSILIDIPPLEKGGEGGFENLCNVDMLPYNISLKELSGNLLIKP